MEEVGQRDSFNINITPTTRVNQKGYLFEPAVLSRYRDTVQCLSVHRDITPRLKFNMLM